MKLKNQTIIALVTGICLFSLAVVLKEILKVSPDVLSRDIIIYIIIYTGFLVSLSTKDEGVKWFKYDTSLFWSALIVLITLAIIIVNAL